MKLLEYDLIKSRYKGSTKSNPFIFSSDDIKTLEFKKYDYNLNEYVPVTILDENDLEIPFILYIGLLQNIPNDLGITSKITLKDGRVIELIIGENVNYWQCGDSKLLANKYLDLASFNVIDTNGIMHSISMISEDLGGRCLLNKLCFILRNVLKFGMIDNNEPIDFKLLGIEIMQCALL